MKSYTEYGSKATEVTQNKRDVSTNTKLDSLMDHSPINQKFYLNKSIQNSITA